MEQINGRTKMNSTVKHTLIIGSLLAGAAAYADVVLDDFATGWAGRNKFGGYWIADSDQYVCSPEGMPDSTRSNCGSSTVTETIANSDVVLNSAAVATTYDGSGIVSNIKVSADVAATTKITSQNWAYAGWVMDMVPADTNGWYSHPWDQPLWDRKGEVDLSACNSIVLKVSFSAQKQLWIELYNPQQAKNSPTAPQYGWRRSAAGTGIETWVLPLGTLGGPVQKWTGAVSDPKIDLKNISRIKILYEGQTGVAVKSPAPYDAVPHELKIAGISVGGTAACKVKGVGSDAIIPHMDINSGLSLSSASGAIKFNNIEGMGDLRVQIRGVSGKVVARSVVNPASPAMQVSQLRNGVYAVQVTGVNFSRSFSVTLLN
jgi:hypothetical protein